MKTLGIIGGVGPQTTAKIYLSVVELVRKSGYNKYPPIVIYNLPFPFIIEKEAIIQGINSEKMLPYLIYGAKILEKAGADFGILPCNTLHKYTNEIRASVKIPFLSILEETSLELQKQKVKTVGILATQSTVNSRIYSSILQKTRIKVLYPSKNEQDYINNIIIEALNGVEKFNDKKMKIIFKSLQKRGAESILLACTDLQLLMPPNSGVKIYDTMKILVDAVVKNMLK